MEEQARAKVNLFLHVVGRRPDGYHLLDSLAVFPTAADILRASPADTLSLTITGPFGAGLEAEPDNLVLRAARALAAKASPGAAPGATITLEKNLPVASGIGGGSADAAATLRLLSRLWNITTDLKAIAATLGADVPVCLASAPARMAGIGELLSPAPKLPPFGMVLVNPGVAIATPAVFRARTPGFRAPGTLPTAWPDAAAMAASLATTRNDLELPALALAPAIADALAWLRTLDNCLLARMSGSGATCFGIFATPPIVTAPPGWWVWTGPA